MTQKFSRVTRTFTYVYQLQLQITFVSTYLFIGYRTYTGPLVHLKCT